MTKLTEDEIKLIIKRASILQKYHEQSLIKQTDSSEQDENPIFEIGASVGLNPQFINEALIEHEGFVMQDPVILDTENNYEVKILGYANGTLDGSLLSELKAQTEYHFDTVGTISRRKGNVYWKAKPAFPAKLFEITSSPEVIFTEQKGQIRIKVSQSLKTINKFYAPAIAATFGAFMMLTAVIYNAAGDTEPMIIVSSMFLLSSYFFSRFIKRRKTKRKKKLAEFAETLQQVIERRFRAGRVKPTTIPSISLEDLDDLNENDDISVGLDRKINT